jgi:hypothetical protein
MRRSAKPPRSMMDPPARRSERDTTAGTSWIGGQDGCGGSIGAKTSIAPLRSRTSSCGSGAGVLRSWWDRTWPVGEKDVEWQGQRSRSSAWDAGRPAGRRHTGLRRARSSLILVVYPRRPVLRHSVGDADSWLGPAFLNRTVLQESVALCHRESPACRTGEVTPQNAAGRR